MRKLKKLIAPFILGLTCVCLALTIQDSEKVHAVELNGTPLESSYALNSSFQLDKTTMNVNGEDVAITGKKIYFPNNTVSFKDEVSLDYAGKYTVEYTADYQGQTYVLTESFEVYDSLYSVDSLSSSAVYGENPYWEGQNGVIVSLTGNSTFYFNPIIDLSEKTKNDELIRLNIIPGSLGIADFKDLYVRLTDVYDANTYIDFCIKKSDYLPNHMSTSYVAAAPNGKAQRGDGDGKKGGAIHGRPYGLWRSFSFTGHFYENPQSESAMPLSLAFDYDDGEVYAFTPPQTNNPYVISLKEDFDVQWKGFTTGEARLSIYCKEHVNNIATFFIESIYDYDLSQTSDLNPVATEPIVDFGGYTEDALPTALVGYKYPVFDATVLTKYGYEKLYTTVYYNYNASGKYVVESKDGYFVPNRAGVYTIEYVAVDKFGNKQIKTVEITAVAQTNPIQLHVAENMENTGTVAHAFRLADYEITGGGYGNVAVTISVERMNGDVVATDLKGEYIPYESGTFNVVYTAVDYVGQTATQKFEVVIENGDVAVFEEKIVLPETMMKNMTYTLPKVMASDYTTGVKKQVETTLSCVGGTLSGYDFTPTEDQAVITYTATVNGKPSNKSITVPVKEAYADDKLLLENYFDLESVTLTGNEEGFEFVLKDANSGSFTFVNPLVAQDMFVNYKAVEGKNNLSAITFILRDYANEEETIRVKIANTAEGTKMILAGDVEYKMSSMDITSSALLVKFEYTGKIVFGTTSMEIPYYENGEPFKGFSSGLVYLTVQMDGEANEAGVIVSSINGQAINTTIQNDNMAPAWAFIGEIGGRYERYATLVLPRFLCMDVLQSQAKATLTVEARSGIVKTTDGTPLEYVDANGVYEIKFTESGRYVLYYEFEDALGNWDYFEYYITVKDGVAPTLSVDTSTLNVKVNESFTIAKAVASDDISKDNKLSIQVFLRNENSYYVIVENGGTCRIEKTGEYTLVYMAVDEAGNYAKATVKVIVS